MGFVDKILGTIGLERKSLRDLEAMLAYGARTASGILASPVAAMKCPAVLPASASAAKRSAACP